MGIGQLPVDRNWVADNRAHPTLLQSLLDPVAAAAFRDSVASTGGGGTAAGVAEQLAAGATADAHHKLVPAVTGLGCRQREAVEIAEGIGLSVGQLYSDSSVPCALLPRLHVASRRTLWLEGWSSDQLFHQSGPPIAPGRMSGVQ